MSSFRISVTENGLRKRVETSLEEFTFYSVIIQDLSIQKVGGQLCLEGPVKVDEPVAPEDAAQLAQVNQLQSVLNDALAGLTDLEDAIAAANLTIQLNAGELDEIRCRVEWLEDNTAVEETITSGVGGQTVFTFTTVKWVFDNSIPDVMVFVEDGKQRQDLAGGLTESFRKLSDVQIEFSETIAEGVNVTARLEGNHTANAKPANPFFRHYLEGVTTPEIVIPSDYDLLTGKLGAYRNGLYMAESPLVGPIAQRYVESARDAISVAPGYEGDVDTFWTFYHLDPVKDTPPTYKIAFTGVAGTVLTIPTYPMGTDQLRIYRNGLLMNAAGVGNLALQYTEATAVSVSLAQAATADEYWVIEVAAIAPAWRDDLDGITGVDVDWTIPNVYTVGDKRLQVWKNGVLLADTVVLWTPSLQYVENGTNCIQLQTAITPDDVITGIYLPV
jgi:hypothetical protein